MSSKMPVYPFAAIVGQEDMKEALILNVVNPALGGVLIRGEKGTAKSTAVRALADLLPPMEVAENCRFHCDPAGSGGLCDDCAAAQKAGQDIKVGKRKMKVVDLPVSATEDRIVGTIDIEHAIQCGEKRFEPGILAEAHRNILYVDEVNLLDDHAVDILLDAAAMGVNTVEREGISFSHPARFVLVGTMNPEEGDVRPQLLDRFGLSVDVTGEADVKRRVEVVRRRLAYENNADDFIDSYTDEQRQLADKILAARQLLPKVELPEQLLEVVAQLAIELDVDGHRADITLIKTAMTMAALHGRKQAVVEDVKRASRFVLSHRMRRRPFEEGAVSWEKVDDLLGRV